MTALYILLGIVGLLLLVLLFPVSLRASFSGEFTVRLRVLGIPFTLYPLREKKPARPAKSARQKRKKKAAKAQKKPSEEKLSASIGRMLKEDGVGAVLHYLKEMAALLGTAVRRILAALTIDRLELHMVLAGEDAAQTAILHGTACSVVFPALALLQANVRVRSREVQVVPDFVQGERRVAFDVRLHACPLRLLWAVLRLLTGYVGYTLKEDSAVRENEPVAAK